MKARALAVVNQKGGCGKTTIAVNLAACLAANGERVLLVDMDPQGHASMALGVNVDDLSVTMYNALTNDVKDMAPFSRTIIEADDNLWLAPSNILLCAIEQQLSGVKGREDRLRNCIAEVIPSYDYCIIDCPPSVGLLSMNVLRIARAALIPIDMSRFSLQGIDRLLETIEMVDLHTAHAVNTRIVANMYAPRTNLSRTMLSTLKNGFGEILCDTPIRRTVKLTEAGNCGLPIIRYAPLSSPHRDFEDLALEITTDPNLFDSPMKFPARVLFSYSVPDANEILVAGEFNNWRPLEQHKLNKQENGEWNTSIPLMPGTYEYKFIVDGEWREDPANPKKKSDHGQTNSVLDVK